MDVTDDGVVFTTDDAKIWLTDGSAIHQIGTGGSNFDLRGATNVSSGTAGSRVAWIASSDQDVEIVVYDTKADGEAARVPAPDCTDLDPGFSGAAGKPHRVCELTSLVNDDHVYFMGGVTKRAPASMSGCGGRPGCAVAEPIRRGLVPRT